MARSQPPVPTMQELIRRRTRQGFVGRNTERAAFRANFELPIEDERRRFLFHVHGNAGMPRPPRRRPGRAYGGVWAAGPTEE